jgi:uncharacterized delta-60 repeat protein
MALRLLVSMVCAATALASAALAAVPGDRDRMFGTSGRVTADFGGSERGSGIAVQPDRKIVVVGASTSSAPVPTDDFLVARSLSSGAPDTGFGSGGKVRSDFGGSVERAWAVLAQPDGKIVVIGDGFPAGPEGLDFVLVRYNGDGSLDSGFGAGGKVLTTFEPDTLDTAQAAILQPDGRIVAAGRARKIGVAGSFALARYLPNGQLDPSFGGDGLVTTPASGGGIVRALALQSDGKIVAAGSSGPSDSAVARYNPDGSLDGSFGGDGMLVGGLGLSIASDVVVQRDGKILVAGGSVVRLNADGTLDGTFGQSGRATMGIVDADSLALQADGRVLVSGTFLGATDSDFGVARLTVAGRLDPGFGRGGVNTTDIGLRSQDQVTDAVLQPDGKLVVAGASRPASDGQPWDLAVARYTVVVPCLVPNVKRKTLAATRVALQRNRCALGKVRRSYSPKVRKGRVMSQRPRAGARLAEFAKVSVVLSRGRKR